MGKKFTSTLLAGMLLPSFWLPAQTAEAAQVYGTVTGPEGVLPGVTVRAQHSGSILVQTVTDGSGNYSLDIPAGNIDYIGPAFPPESPLMGEDVRNVGLNGDREVRLFAANKVTLSGHIDVPPELVNRVDINVQRLDKETPQINLSIDPDYNFEATVPAGVYAILVYENCRWGTYSDIYICPLQDYFSFASVDASTGSVGGISVPIKTPGAPLIPETPPDATKISVGPADPGGIATVTGAPGATSTPAMITVINLHTGHYNRGASRSDGSFSISLLAPPGTWLEVRQDPTQLSFGGPTGAGTIIQAPLPGDPSVSFATLNDAFEWSGPLEGSGPVENVGIEDGGQIWISGNLSDRNWSPGETIELSGSLKIYSRDAATLDTDSLFKYGRVSLERVFDESGTQERATPVFLSHWLTPTGVPVERPRTGGPELKSAVLVGEIDWGALNLSSPSSLDGTWSSTIRLPANLPPGTYSLVLEPFIDDIQQPTLHFEDAFRMVFDTPLSLQGAALIKVGAPQPGRLSWALGINDHSNGTRGTVAVEDRNKLGIAGRQATNTRAIVLDREDPRTGIPRRYRLEPFVPLVGVGNRGWMPPPTVPFSWPSGQLTVSIRQPDGSTINLDPAPFKGAYVQQPIVVGLNGDDPGNRPIQYFGLTTLEEHHEVAFTQYGLHHITMTGSVDDNTGTTYEGGGTYEVWVARRLDIETGVFPGTPFEVGDHFSPSVIVQPGVEAKVTVELTHYPKSDPARAIRRTISGKANRFGFFQPARSESPRFDQPGEYRVDYTVTYRDEDGVLWVGMESWASVVETPDSALIAHGARNFNCQENTRQQWMTAEQEHICGTHLPFPYHTGDIAWMEDTDVDPFFTAMFPAVTLQDTEGSFTDMLRDRPFYLTEQFPYNREQLFSIGQILPYSSTPSGLPAPLALSAPDTHVSYAYSSAARPGVRVRDMVTELENQESYWRFEGTYYDQHGVGANGDQPNDFKFQFGGSVYRAPDLDFYHYGAYASLWVGLRKDDPVGTRVMPPFQGNGGGPTGGPIMTLQGQDIDSFFHPGAVRPGSILEVGQLASFAGQVAPTLAAQVQLIVRSPSGEETYIDRMTNRIGYFHDPETDIRVLEPGPWFVDVTVTHRGQTSAGPLQAPYPTGTILGSLSGSYHFYVVDKGSAPLQVDGPGETWLKPGAGPIGFSIQAPEGWTNLTVHRTTVMPGFLLEDVTGNDLSFTYDAPTLAQTFPNLDLEDRDGVMGVDTITLSVLLQGLDAEGNPQFRARQLLLQGEQLMRPLQKRSDDMFGSDFER